MFVMTALHLSHITDITFMICTLFVGILFYSIRLSSKYLFIAARGEGNFEVVLALHGGIYTWWYSHTLL